MIKTNYHSHCYLCQHAQGLPSDYIKKAVEIGYKEIGISDHGPMLKEWTNRMNLDDFYNIYLPDLKNAIKQYSNKIKIYKGLELEFFEGYDEHYQRLLKDLDYLILGQHVVVKDGRIYDIFKGMDDEKIEIYKDTVIKAMETGYFQILAHPEIFMFKYRTWNALTERISKEIIEAAIKNKVLLEINANGIRRGTILNQDKEKTYIYPRLEFWRLVSHYPDALVIISEDNHALHQVDDDAVATARNFAKKLNIKVTSYLFGDNND